MSEHRFGPYRIVQELDSGVATTVSRARHESLPRDVAIKHLRDVVAPQSAFAVALEREAQILAELSHANIVTLYDFVKTERTMGLVLEHIEGFRLDAVRDNAGGRLTSADVATVGTGLADALTHAHAHGVVHRDVKPSNVLIGKHGELKLLDFGAAAYVGESDAHAPSGGGELAFGTPAYLAPEQLLGAEADPKSDIFSLGVVLYELACGEKPFESRSRDADAVPLVRRASELNFDPSLAALIDRALAPAPADRPTAEELAAQLREFSPRVGMARATRALLAHARLGENSVPLPPRRSPPSSTAARFAARRKTVLAAGAGALLLAALGLVAIGRERPKANAANAAAGAGELHVLANPWAEVWIDGKLIETTPLARALILSAGSHRVVLRHPDAPDEVREVAISASEPVTLDVTMAIRELAVTAGVVRDRDAGEGDR